MAEAIMTDEVTQAAMADEVNQSVNLGDSQAAISDIAKGIRDKYAMTNTDYLSQPSPKYGGDAVLAINKATGEALITNRSDLPLDENFDVKMRIQKPAAEVSKPAYAEFGQGQPATIQPTAKVDPLDTEPARRVQIEAIASQTIKNKYNGFDRVAAKDPDKIDKYVNDRFEKTGEQLFKKLFGNSWRYRDQENMPKEMKTQWLTESGKARARIEKELDEFTKMVEGEEKAFISHLEKVRQEKSKIEAAETKTKAGFVSWTPEAKKQEFMEHIIGGKPPVNAAGLGGQERAAYAKEYAQWKVDNGFTPQTVKAIQSDYKAGDASLRNMTKQEAPMRAFVTNIGKQVDYAQSLFQYLQRTDARALNIPLVELRKRLIGSGLEAQYDMFVKEISAEALKLSQGSSASIAQIPEGNRQEWERIHDTKLPLKEIMPVFQATKKMADMRLSTWVDAKNVVRNELEMVGTKKEPTSELQPAVDYIKTYADKYSQKQLYEALLKEKWTPDQIKSAWRTYRGK